MCMKYVLSCFFIIYFRAYVFEKQLHIIDDAYSMKFSNNATSMCIYIYIYNQCIFLSFNLFLCKKNKIDIYLNNLSAKINKRKHIIVMFL